MVKLMLLLRRRPDLTREAFIRYYEEQHAPFAMELTPGVFLDYRRNYVLPEGIFSPAHIGDPAANPDFDVITEIWFKSDEAFDQMVNALKDPEIGSRLRADEMQLFDTRPGAMLLVRVDERVSAVT